VCGEPPQGEWLWIQLHKKTSWNVLARVRRGEWEGFYQQAIGPGAKLAYASGAWCGMLLVSEEI
jgi:hypothetical protein